MTTNPTPALPPLPEPFTELHREISPVVYQAWVDQMHAYALAYGALCRQEAVRPLTDALAEFVLRAETQEDRRHRTMLARAVFDAENAATGGTQ